MVAERPEQADLEEEQEGRKEDAGDEEVEDEEDEDEEDDDEEDDEDLDAAVGLSMRPINRPSRQVSSHPSTASVRPAAGNPKGAVPASAPIPPSSLPDVSFASLKRHGFAGGPSVLLVPQAADSADVDWGKWGTKSKREEGARGGEEEEERTRQEEREESERLQQLASSGTAEAAAARAIQQHREAAAVQRQLREEERQQARHALGRAGPPAEGGAGAKRGGAKEELSFSQREKRKRDAGQASRGKSYVEEEKRLLRGSGVYSGFDC